MLARLRRLSTSKTSKTMALAPSARSHSHRHGRHSSPPFNVAIVGDSHVHWLEPFRVRRGADSPRDTGRVGAGQVELPSALFRTKGSHFAHRPRVSAPDHGAVARHCRSSCRWERH